MNQLSNPYPEGQTYKARITDQMFADDNIGQAFRMILTVQILTALKEKYGI